MHGSRRKTEPRGPYGQREESTYRWGHHSRCELCEREGRCFDRFDMVACQACQDALLPSRGFLL